MLEKWLHINDMMTGKTLGRDDASIGGREGSRTGANLATTNPILRTINRFIMYIGGNSCPVDSLETKQVSPDNGLKDWGCLLIPGTSRALT